MVRCNVSGAKLARKKTNILKNILIMGSLLIFKDEMLCSVHSNIFPAQGQAISVLVRAHSSTGDTSYLEAATRCVLFLLILIRKLIVDRFANLFKYIALVRAAAVFGKSTSEDGVAATVLGHVWYQEYPTQPAR